jgi:hypothetical protein
MILVTEAGYHGLVAFSACKTLPLSTSTSSSASPAAGAPANAVAARRRIQARRMSRSSTGRSCRSRPRLECLMRICRTTCLKANYSNSRLALLEFRRRIEAYQHAVIVWQLCRQVWARWMDTAVLAGAIDLPDYDQWRREYLACGWLPPKWDWVDPLKDARAEIEQIDAGLKSRTQALAERGYDVEQVDAEIAADKAREQSRSVWHSGRFRVSEWSQTLLREWIRTSLANQIYPS